MRSIVAVQGLWANPERTWRSQGVLWLSDLLPQDLSSAAILSFGPTVSETRPGLLSAVLTASPRSLSTFLACASAGLSLLGAWAPRWRTASFFTAAGLQVLHLGLYLRRYQRRLNATPVTAIRDRAAELLDALLEHQRAHVRPCPQPMGD